MRRRGRGRGRGERAGRDGCDEGRGLCADSAVGVGGNADGDGNGNGNGDGNGDADDSLDGFECDSLAAGFVVSNSCRSAVCAAVVLEAAARVQATTGEGVETVADAVPVADDAAAAHGGGGGVAAAAAPH